MSKLRFLTIGLALAAVASGTLLLLQRKAADQLRDEIGLVRDENRELARLRTENQRLVADLPAKEKLEAQRNDHAAVARMRDELQKLRDDLQRREKALADAASRPTEAGPVAQAPVAK